MAAESRKKELRAKLKAKGLSEEEIDDAVFMASMLKSGYTWDGGEWFRPSGEPVGKFAQERKLTKADSTAWGKAETEVKSQKTKRASDIENRKKRKAFRRGVSGGSTPRERFD